MAARGSPTVDDAGMAEGSSDQACRQRTATTVIPSFRRSSRRAPPRSGDGTERRAGPAPPLASPAVDTDDQPSAVRRPDATLLAVVIGVSTVGLAQFPSSYVLVIFGVGAIVLVLRDVRASPRRAGLLTRLASALALGGGATAVLTPFLWAALAASSVGGMGGGSVWWTVLAGTERGWATYTPLSEASVMTFAPIHLASSVPAGLWLALTVVAYLTLRGRGPWTVPSS